MSNVQRDNPEPDLDSLANLDVLDERPALRRPSTARALSDLVAHERTRQDARMQSMRRLRGEAEALFDGAAAGRHGEHGTPDGGSEAGRSGGLRARIGAAFRRSKVLKRKAPDEAELRARYEQAQVRARRAVVFAESLGALEGELAEELKRLGDVLVDLAHDETSIDGVLARVRSASMGIEGDLTMAKDAERRRALESALDKAKGRVSSLEAERDAVRTAEDRLLGLVEGEKMLATRLAHLRVEVERAAKEATRRLDDVADALRALVTAEDARHVVAELEQALERLVGSLDESARLAKDASDALGDEKSRR